MFINQKLYRLRRQHPKSHLHAKQLPIYILLRQEYLFTKGATAPATGKRDVLVIPMPGIQQYNNSSDGLGGPHWNSKRL